MLTECGLPALSIVRLKRGGVQGLSLARLRFRPLPRKILNPLSIWPIRQSRFCRLFSRNARRSDQRMRASVLDIQHSVQPRMTHPWGPHLFRSADRCLMVGRRRRVPEPFYLEISWVRVKLGYFARSSMAYALGQVYNAEILFAGCVFILFSFLVR